MYIFDEEIVQFTKQETQGGHDIISFLLSAMYAEHPRFKPSHQISAARVLTEVGSKEARSFIQQFNPYRPKRAPASARADDAADESVARTQLDPQLAKIVAEETDGGRSAVRFLIDVMDDNFPDFSGRRRRFTPWQRLSACRELLRIGFMQYYGPDKPPRPSEAMRRPDGQPAPSELKRRENQIRDANRAHPDLSRARVRNDIVATRVIEHDPSNPNPLADTIFRLRDEAADRARRIADTYADNRSLDAPLNRNGIDAETEPSQDNAEAHPADRPQTARPDSQPRSGGSLNSAPSPADAKPDTPEIDRPSNEPRSEPAAANSPPNEILTAQDIHRLMAAPDARKPAAARPHPAAGGRPAAPMPNHRPLSPSQNGATPNADVQPAVPISNHRPPPPPQNGATPNAHAQRGPNSPPDPVPYPDGHSPQKDADIISIAEQVEPAILADAIANADPNAPPETPIIPDPRARPAAHFEMQTQAFAQRVRAAVARMKRAGIPIPGHPLP